MRRVQINMGQGNYIKIANTHIFINFNKDNLIFLNSINPKSLHKIHVFITDHESVNESLRIMIQKYGRVVGTKERVYKKDGVITHTKVISKRHSRIALHLPRWTDSLPILLRKFLGNEKGTFCYGSKLNTSFSGRNHSDYSVNFFFHRYYLEVNVTNASNISNDSKSVEISYPHYMYDTSGGVDNGIFENAEMRLTPDLFRDKLIEAFKKECPPNIIKSFKNDDDIWNYINKYGEWEVVKDDKK